MIKEVLTINSFRAWLQRFSKFGIVGHARQSCNCPLANYLKSVPGVLRARVGPNAATVTEPVTADDKILLPTWARSFVGRIDQFDAGEPVRQLDALCILNDIEREL